MVILKNLSNHLPLPESIKEKCEVIDLPTNQENIFLDQVQKYQKKLKMQTILPGGELSVLLANQANRDLGLPGLHQNCWPTVKLKNEMRKVLDEAGLKNICYFVAQHFTEIPAIIEKVGFPCVIKPVNYAGSVAVSLASNPKELAKSLKTALSLEDYLCGYSLKRAAIIEQYIEGPEFSIEGFVENGEAQIVSVTEKILGPHPYFVERGHIVEAHLNQRVRDKIFQYVKKIITVMKINLGPFHMEIRLDQEEPILIEIAARLAGDHIIDLIHISKKIDLRKIMIQNYLNMPISVLQYSPPKIKKTAGIIYFIRDGLRSYNSVHGIDALKKLEGLEEYHLDIAPHEPIPEAVDYRGRIGYSIFSASSYEKLKNNLMQADRCLIFK